MMDNRELAAAFKLLSQLMELHGENPFKAKAYAGAAFKIEREGTPLAGVDPEKLAIPGIGVTISEQIKELLQTGQLTLLEEYLSKTPPGVIQLLSVKGIGPKKIGVLWRTLGIESIGALAYACQENRLVALKGFGAKTQAQLLQNIAFLQAHDGYYLYATIDTFVNDLKDALSKEFPQYQTAVAGAFRRQCIVLNKIDWVSEIPYEQLQSYFSRQENVAVTFHEKSIQVKYEQAPDQFFYYAAPGAFNVLLFLHTNTDAFNEAFSATFSIPPQPTSEAEIFHDNGLHFVPAALRENGNYLGHYKKDNEHEPDPLIQTTDIRGIIHAHSQYSDGRNSLEEMARAAIEKGYEYLVISDHSQAAAYANGLSPESVSKQHTEIDRLNDQLHPFRIFKGIEADILSTGALDYEAAILATFDLVIASIHSNLKMSGEKAMQRLLTAIRNPFTSILGHPTGRLLLSRNGYPIDHKVVIDACATHGVVIEINAHPRRLDLDWSWIPYAIERGVVLSIDPDAHSVDGMDLVKYGVLAAQKGGLTPAHNLSSKPIQAFETWLRQQKQRRSF